MFLSMFETDQRDAIKKKLLKDPDKDDYDFLQEALPLLSAEDREFFEEFFEAQTFAENFFYWENFKLKLSAAKIDKE